MCPSPPSLVAFWPQIVFALFLFSKLWAGADPVALKTTPRRPRCLKIDLNCAAAVRNSISRVRSILPIQSVYSLFTKNKKCIPCPCEIGAKSVSCSNAWCRPPSPLGAMLSSPRSPPDRGLSICPAAKILAPQRPQRNRTNARPDPRAQSHARSRCDAAECKICGLTECAP